MRLLHTTKFEVELFYEKDVPRYATLSHTWEEEEVTLDDLRSNPQVKHMKGYKKLQQSCKLAAREGYEYIWIDTCCMDKSSSAELSEAINSMYRWYAMSDICYAYLSDVTVPGEFQPPAVRDVWGNEDRNDGGPAVFDSILYLLRRSRWFTRGWTLQELIAPARCHFYSKEWQLIGNKFQLASVIHEITEISLDSLEFERISSIPVSAKMRWASRRETTRPEDMAYCLMGIFSVNMPLLYGEGGQRAFLRLQEEIIKSTDDDSIFAWQVPEGKQSKPFWGMLAESPAYFRLDNCIVVPSRFMSPRPATPAAITSRGLSIELRLSPLPGDRSDCIFLGFLCCDIRNNPWEFDKTPAILLQRLSEASDVAYARVRPNVLLEVQNNKLRDEEMARKFRGLIDTDGCDLSVNTSESAWQKIYVIQEWRSWKYQPPNGFFFISDQWRRGFGESKCEMELLHYSQAWRFHEIQGTDNQTCVIDFNKWKQHYAPNPVVLPRSKEHGWVESRILRKYGRFAPISFSFRLAIGLEPQMENPCETPPTQLRPWYEFKACSASDASLERSRVVGSGQSRNTVLILEDPGQTVSFGVSFALECRNSRLFYSMNLQSVKLGSFDSQRAYIARPDH
jgi:Heterokaryon incompatibility protein (HET)